MSLRIPISRALKKTFSSPLRPGSTVENSVMTLLVVGEDVLDPSIIADAGNGIGVDGNGWVARAVVPYQESITFDPKKVILTVQDPGFDATGTTTVTRTIRGTQILRRQYPNEALLQHSNDGTDYTVFFALSDEIYAGSTVTDVTIEPGYYGDAESGNVAATSESTLPYEKPLFAWLNTQHERATGSAFSVEAVAFSNFAKNGRQVARVEFVAKDAQSTPNTVTQTSSTVSLSAFQTQGNIVEAYKASIPLTGLTQADLCQVNARVYPWLGDSTAILDLEADGIAWPTANPQTRLRFLNDKNETYGGAYAYVKSGAVGGVVSLTAATARATPYPTMNAAVLALAAFNNTNRGHNDHSGAKVRLMDDGVGGAVQHTPTANMASAVAGLCWTEIEQDPLNTATASILLTATRSLPDLIKIKVPIQQNTSGWFDGVTDPGSKMFAVEGVTVTCSGNAAGLNYRMAQTYLRNVTVIGTVTGGSQALLGGFGTTKTQTALALGHICNATSAMSSIVPFVLIGSRLSKIPVGESSTVSYDSMDGRVIANNSLMATEASAHLFANNVDIVRGVALVQNVFERSTVGSSPNLQIGADSMVRPMKNVIDMYNTVVGERTNRAYTDVAGSVGIKKRMRSRFNIWHEYNVKSDTFGTNTTVSGRVGNWSVRYTVGFEGNIALTGSAGAEGSTPDPYGSSWLGERWPDSLYEVGKINVPFTDDQSGSTLAGNGTYSLTGASNAAYDRVPAGRSGLSFDLAGTSRRNDGTGAAGAYERA